MIKDSDLVVVLMEGSRQVSMFVWNRTAFILIVI